MLVVDHSDNFAKKKAGYDYFLDVRGGKVLHLTVKGAGLSTLGGQRVKVRGRRTGNTIAVAGGVAGVARTGAPVLTPGPVTTNPDGTYDTTTAVTQRRLAVIMFNFSDRALQPGTPAMVKQLVFGTSASVNAFYFESSYGALSLRGSANPSGDVFGWFTIAAKHTGCDLGTWSAQARAAAAAAGFVDANYDNVMYVFPGGQCQWAGLGEVPGRQTWVQTDSIVSGWDQASFRGVAAHELGHNFGLWHASTQRCTDRGVRVAYSASCSIDEYGDPFSVMGNSGQGRQVNGVQKQELHFMPDANVVDSPVSGIYALETSSRPAAPGELQGLRIPHSWNVDGSPADYLYVDGRSPWGFDGFSPGDPVVNGVSLRLAPPATQAGRTRLLDMTPATNDFYDGALALNQSFTDPTTGTVVTTVGVTPTTTIVQVQAPPVPTNIHSTATSAISLALAWDPPADVTQVAGYRVYRVIKGRLTHIGYTVGPNATSFVDTKLEGGIAYQYAVRAYRNGDSFNFPQSALATVSTVTWPELAPLGLGFTATTTSSITLAWGAPSDTSRVGGYRVYRSLTGANWSYVGYTTGASATSYTDRGLQPATLYFYSVHTFEPGGSDVGAYTPGLGTWTNALPPPPPPPQAPVNLRATGTTSSSVSMAWDAPTDVTQVAGYRIYRRNGAVWQQVGTAPGAATTSFANTGLSAATAYLYEVVAYTPAGSEGAMGAAVSMTTAPLAPPNPNQAPANLRTTSVTPSTVSLTWDVPLDSIGVGGYRVYRLVGATWTHIGYTTGVNATSFTDPTRLAAATTYQYMVHAYDGALLNLTDSAPLTVTTAIAPAPANVRTTAVAQTSVSLAWDAPADTTGVGGYRIWRLVGTTWTHQGYTTGAGVTTFVNTGLAANTTYQFRVCAWELGSMANLPMTPTFTVTTAP